MINAELWDEMIENERLRENHKLLKEAALVALQGILASGRTSVVNVGNPNDLHPYSVEKGAIMVAKRFLKCLEEEVQNGQPERK